MNKWNKLRKQNLGAIPQEASPNLNAPETAPSRLTNKVNIRTKPLNFKVSEEFYWQLKELALKEKKLMVEIIEKALQTYQQKEQSANTLQQNLKNIEKQVKSLQGTMSWKEVEAKLSKLNPNLFQQVGLPITYEVLKETLEEFARLDKEKKWNSEKKSENKKGSK